MTGKTGAITIIILLIIIAATVNITETVNNKFQKSSLENSSVSVGSDKPLIYKGLNKINSNKFFRKKKRQKSKKNYISAMVSIQKRNQQYQKFQESQ
jgi:uncharacterized membrane protein YhiD involved in acid resistance